MSDFDTVFKQFKDNTKPMCELMGCPELVEDFIVDVEINRQSFKSFYEAGQQHQQAKIDDLQAKVGEVLIEMKNQLGDEDFCDMQRPDYDAMLYALRNIKDILKGGTND